MWRAAAGKGEVSGDGKEYSWRRAATRGRDKAGTPGRGERIREDGSTGIRDGAAAAVALRIKTVCDAVPAFPYSRRPLPSGLRACVPSPSMPLGVALGGEVPDLAGLAVDGGATLDVVGGETEELVGEGQDGGADLVELRGLLGRKDDVEG